MAMNACVIAFAAFKFYGNNIQGRMVVGAAGGGVCEVAVDLHGANIKQPHLSSPKGKEIEKMEARIYRKIEANRIFNISKS